MKISSVIPDHVPGSLVWERGLNDFVSEMDDPFIAASRLHEGPGIIWSTEASLGKASWVATRYDVIKDIILDYEHFSNERDSSTDAVLPEFRMIPVEVDPPEHQHYRRIFQPYFSPRKMLDYGEMVGNTCLDLIDRIPNPEECEFISEFAAIFPNSIFLTLMGLPQKELPQFMEWERQLLRSSDTADYEAAQEAGQKIFRYLGGFIEEQRKHPERRTEFINALLTATKEGEPVSDLDVLGTCFLFYVAGLDTVYSTIGWIMRHLAMDLELQDHLRNNPQDLPKAVEEFTRAYAVAAPHRRVVEDIEFHGVKLKKDDVILLPLYLAARDPRAYKNPHQIDLDRNDARSITFGTGPHLCLGVHLAKREIATVLEAFLSKFKSITLQEGKGYEYHVGGVLGVDQLPLTLRRHEI